jgi:gamma-tubulin complex component 2
VDVRIENRVIEEDEEEEEVAPEVVERLLDGVPLEVQEAWICEDLVFVLQVSSGARVCDREGELADGIGCRGAADTIS